MSSVSSEERVEIIPLHCIKPSDVALRAVDKESDDYLKLVDSIRTNGILNPILVSDLGEGVYGLIDGLHRYNGARDAGKTTIPALIRSFEDTALMEAQIITNLHKVETKPMEYTKQLFRLLSADPMLTKSDLADKLSVTTKWLEDRLSLSNLKRDIQELVNEGRIKLANAYSLAKLPEDEQAEYVDRAMTDPPTSFIPLVSQRIKQIKDANKQGRNPAPAEFTPIARVQSRSTLETELEKQTNVSNILKGAKTVEEAYANTLRWVLNLHPEGVEEQRSRWEQRKAQLAQAKEDAKKARELKKQEAAAAAAADISRLG